MGTEVPGPRPHHLYWPKRREDTGEWETQRMLTAVLLAAAERWEALNVHQLRQVWAHVRIGEPYSATREKR